MRSNFNNLYEKLVSYGNSDYYGFHMPGHKRNKYVTGAGLPYEIDITEIEGFDDLHHARGILQQAQQRAEKVFHGEETFFLINGSTVGILSAILGCTQREDKILIARNCHRSVYHAVYMNELKPLYVYPQYFSSDVLSDKNDVSHEEFYLQMSLEGEKWNLNGEINPKEVEQILKKNQDSSSKCKIRAVVITSPTYDGVVSDVTQIAEIVHSYGIPLIVDEAHGAHFGFHPYFPENANSKGADVVIHSIHKTLPALTQTALIHMNGRFADRERIKKYLHILQSSSPSYVLLAGIDTCIGWLESGEKDILFDSYTALLRETREKLKKMRYLKLIETDNFDFSKIVISVTGTKYSGRKLYRELLEEYHLQMEMAADCYVLAMTSVGDTKEGFERLVRALYEIDGKIGEEMNSEFGHKRNRKINVKSERQFEQKCNHKLNLSGLPRLEQVYTSAEVEQIARKDLGSVRSLSWDCSSGRISMEYAYLYPPGIPLIVPGEKISEEVILLIHGYRKKGFQIEGLENDRYIKTIEI